MKKYVLIIALAGLDLGVSGQNLIPNGDFEQYVGCPVTPGQFHYDSVLFWESPIFTSPDYFNQCNLFTWSVSVPTNYAGYQVPQSGAAYSGIFLWSAPNYREYLAAPLLYPLAANTCYYFEM